MTETQGMLKKHSKESSNLKMSPTSTSKGLAEKAIKLSLEKEKIEDKSSISVPTVDSPIEILENQATVESEIEDLSSIFSFSNDNFIAFSANPFEVLVGDIFKLELSLLCFLSIP